MVSMSKRFTCKPNTANNFGAAGVTALTEMLKTNTTLTQLKPRGVH